MSHLFNQLPGHPRTTPGRERQILRMLPKALAIGTAVLALPALAVRGAALLNPVLGATSLVMSVDIYSISLVVLHWTVVFTVGLSAFIEMVMKGPGYVADPYPLSDADRPAVARPDTLPPGQG